MEKINAIFVIAIGVIILVSHPSIVLADVIQGEVVSVKSDGSAFRLKHANQEVDVAVKPETQFQGLDSVKDLTVSDEVVVDGMKLKGTKIWEADVIKISKVKIHAIN